MQRFAPALASSPIRLVLTRHRRLAWPHHAEWTGTKAMSPARAFSWSRRGSTATSPMRCSRDAQNQAADHAARESTMKSAAKQGRKANRRGAARLTAVQALYQMDLAATPLNDILAEFESHWLGREVEGSKYLPAEAAFFREIVGGFVREQRRLDPLIDRTLAGGWPLKRVEALLRAALRAGAFELDQRRDVPARVVISEYVDVANAFLDGEETGMINAVLDLLARQLRSGEFG